MRFFAVLALTAIVSAARLNSRQSGLPDCAGPCIAKADFGSCDPSDDGCLCNSSAFVNSVTTCITGACSGDDLTNAYGAAQALCAAVGVTLTATPSQTGAPASSNTAPAPSQTSAGDNGGNGAASHGASALAALAAVGAVALVL